MQKLSHIFALFLHLIWQFAEVATAAENLPHNPCPELFQYMENNGNYSGLVTLKNIKASTTNLDVEFVDTATTETNALGRISLLDSEQNIINNIKNSLPVLYRIEFPNLKIPPKLNRIIVNDDVICSGLPVTKFKLQHTLLTLNTMRNYAQTNARNSSTTPTDFQLISKNSQNLTAPQQKPEAMPPQLPEIISTGSVENSTNQNQIQLSCGQGSLKSSYGIKGLNLLPEQMTWIVPIYVSNNGSTNYHCAGTLISTRTIISAANCFRDIDPAQITVFVGARNLNDLVPTLIHNVSQVLFSGLKTKEADTEIALLHLAQPVKFSQFVQPACLWNESEELEKIEDSAGFFASWGPQTAATSRSAIIFDTVLLTNSDCMRSFAASTDLFKDSTFCARKRTETGPCQGDTGSGLIFYRNRRWTLRGILSHGNYDPRTDACSLNDIMIFFDVAKYESWIRENILI